MKIHTVLLCSILATTTSVVARASEIDPPLSAQTFAASGKTRAEVKAETRRALKAGEVTFGDVGYPRVTGAADSSQAGRSRADVKAETRQALAAGEITFGDVAVAKPTSTDGEHLTRTAVKGELMRSIAAHEFHFSDTAYPDSGIVTTPKARGRAKAVSASPTSIASGGPAS